METPDEPPEAHPDLDAAFRVLQATRDLGIGGRVSAAVLADAEAQIRACALAVTYARACFPEPDLLVPATADGGVSE